MEGRRKDSFIWHKDITKAESEEDVLLVLYLGGGYTLHRSAYMHHRHRSSLNFDREKKQKILIAARKAQTSLAKVIDMLDHDTYCIDTLQQALAVQGLWRRVIEEVFADHLRTCFREVLSKGKKADQDRVIEEVIRTLNLAERR